MWDYLWNLIDPAVTWEGVATSRTKLVPKVPLWKRLFFGRGR